VLESQQRRDAETETLQFAPDKKESYEFNIGVLASKHQRAADARDVSVRVG